MILSLAATLVTIVGGQDLFLAKKPTRGQCKPSGGARLEPSSDPFQELCYLLYKNGEDYSVSWTISPNLQDHIAYDLVTLWKLGADATQLNATYEFHLKAEMLMPLNASTGSINESNWKDRLGRNAYLPDIDYKDYLDFYRKEVGKQGVEEALTKYLPSLIDGGFGKLFHGQQMIGWSYSETGDAEMAAQGLAWMSSAFSPPAPLASKPVHNMLVQTFEEMHSDSRLPVFKGDATMNYGVFFGNLVANYSKIMAEYDLDVADNISIKEGKEIAKEMEYASSKLFVAYNFSSFAHIHMISSARAVSNFMDLLPAPARAQLLRREWQGILYNYAIQSRPAPSFASLPSGVRSWKEIVAGTFKQTEWHLHELVLYAKESLEGSDRDIMYQVAADRALAFIEGGGKWQF